ncbi:MAG: type II secretion system secretin GspD [Luminiphilus sp.]|jgi:general secretion pathway protein D|nr:type II secretion system secretin GspD [Luminiphilus sp.]
MDNRSVNADKFCKQWCFLGALVLTLAGCAATAEYPGVSGSDSLSSDRAVEEAASEESAGNAAMPESVPSIFLGADNPVLYPPARPPISLDGDAVMVNFEQAPLAEVVHSIMGETLGLDYVIEHPVKGEITLRTRSPIARDQLLPILESLLRNNNVLMIRGPDDRYFISGSANARTTVPSFQSAPTGGFSNVIIPLQYVSAAEMAEILKPVAPSDAFVRIDSRRNLLILAGTQTQLEGWLDIIATFDIDQLAGVSVGIFPLTNSTAEEVFTELEQILADSAGDAPGAGLISMVRVMPIERLNSIMVVSPRAHYIQSVGEWVRTLDSIEDEGSEPTLHVYPVRNGDAGQLASLLSTIYAESRSGGSAGSGARRSGVAPGMTQTSTGGLSSAMPQRNAGDGGGPGASFDLGDGIRVVSDDYNNSLLVLATPYEYQKIERTLIKLDVVAKQVLIEASIIEVTLTDGLEYGLEWAFDNYLGGGDTGTGLFDMGGGLGPSVPGFSYTVADSADAVKAVVNALAEKSLINVISTPSVMVLDNHTAAIHVGDQQPIRSASTVTTGGNVQQSIQYKDTGVKLEVTPSVNDGGLVTLDINQSITDVGPVDAATGQRSFLERNVSSRVAIRSGESVVLGGLIRDNEAQGKSGIPLLMDIPGLGALFSTNNTVSSRTELLIFISPRVLEGLQDLRDLNAEMRDRMKGLEDFSDLPVRFGDEDGE